MICMADVGKHFKAIVLVDPPSTTTQRVELVAQTWETLGVYSTPDSGPTASLTSCASRKPNVCGSGQPVGRPTSGRWVHVAA
jgi:hypothetical protein